MFELSIGGYKVGPGNPCFIIAEAGVNHNGDTLAALELVDAAANAGANAVKFQTFRAERLANKDAPKASYQLQSTSTSETQYEMLKRLELSEEAHHAINAHCAKRGIVFLSTPFDEESADFLHSLQVPAFKIPSGEITNIPFLQHVARIGKPIILSTGMSTLAEVDVAVAAIRASGNSRLALLHCVSNYPADPADVNLRAVKTMVQAFGLAVGYSDHTMGDEICIAAVALGACIIEKHFTLDRNLPGPDQKASLEPAELAAAVLGIRNTEAALGNGRKVPAASEANTIMVARKSLVAATPIPAGTVILKEHIVVRRPGTGLSPALKAVVIGRVAKKNIAENDLLNWEML